MSLYRFLRLTAILALLKKYERRLARMAAAIAFALVTVALYGDVADYLDKAHPQWSATALIVKTGLVYLVLIYCLWQMRMMLRHDELTPPSKTDEVALVASPIDQLIEKPQLRSRREAILKGDSPKP